MDVFFIVQNVRAIHHSAVALFLRPDSGGKYCDERVCLCVCVVCPRLYLRNCTSDLHQFLCMLPVARSSSGGIMLRISGFVDDAMFAHTGKLSRASVKLLELGVRTPGGLFWRFIIRP